jgi:AcrR family transcriptional regulator
MVSVPRQRYAVNVKTQAEPTARERIMATASGLFYREGFRAVGIDRIIAEAGVAKMSLYRNFATKDDLIIACMRNADAQMGAMLDAAVAEVADPKDKLIAVIATLQAIAVGPECKGCSFQVLAAEYPDVDHPAHEVAADHKRSILARLTTLARQAKLKEPAALAGQLSLLIDGAWVAPRMFGPDNHARSLTRAAKAIIEAHTR